jgi:hypothetical protein
MRMDAPVRERIHLHPRAFGDDGRWTVEHLDSDRLVDLALFDGSADIEETVHLADCARCRAEIEALKKVAEIGAETQTVRHLPPPPDSVWAGIVAATGVGTKPAASIERDGDVVRPLPPARGNGHNRRRPRKWLPPFMLATAAAVLAIVGTLAVMQLADRQPPSEVTARATLAPLRGAPPSARGDAEVLDGEELRVDVSRLPLTAGYYEVWLLNPDDISKMQSLGSLPSKTEDVVLPIPPGTDLNTYRLVDVSAEQHDGNSAHSGDSLLRGTLTN